MNQKSNKLIKIAIRVTKRPFVISLQDEQILQCLALCQIIYHRSKIQKYLDKLIAIYI